MVKKTGCNRFLENLDTYGIPVNLTYQKNPDIKSSLGGLMTILSRLLIITFLGLQIKDVVRRKYTLQTSSLKRNFFVDDSQLQLTNENFDLGIRVVYMGESEDPGVQDNLEQYVDIKIMQYNSTWRKDSQGKSTLYSDNVRQNLVKCNSTRLAQKPNTSDYLGIQRDFLCPESIDLRIGGSMATSKYDDIGISVRRCNQTWLDIKYGQGSKKCKSIDEQERVGGKLRINFVMLNSYFDDKDFQEPIKTNMKNFVAESKFNTSQQYFFYLSQNMVSLDDSIIYSNPEYVYYIESRMEFYNLIERYSESDQENSFVYFSILFDDSYRKTKRKVMTIPDAFSETGGFMTIIFILSKIILGRFQSTIYFSTLIKSFYRYNPEDQDEDKKADDDSERQIHENYNVQKIIQRLEKREKLRYGLCEDMQNELKRKCCFSNTISKRKLMFETAKKMVLKDLDIRSIQNQILKLKFIASILLRKDQWQLFPYFKECLISSEGLAAKEMPKNLSLSIQQSISNIGNNKIDKRIIKNIADPQTYHLFQEQFKYNDRSRASQSTSNRSKEPQQNFKPSEHQYQLQPRYYKNYKHQKNERSRTPMQKRKPKEKSLTPRGIKDHHQQSQTLKDNKGFTDSSQTPTIKKSSNSNNLQINISQIKLKINDYHQDEFSYQDHEKSHSKNELVYENHSKTPEKRKSSKLNKRSEREPHAKRKRYDNI